MSPRINSRALGRFALGSLGAAGLASVAAAQATFSIDWHGPTVSIPDSFGGVPITEGDILVPAGFTPAFGPLPPPGILISGGAAGLGLAFHAGCVGHPGGTPCRVEVDALSYGTDHTMNPNTPVPTGQYLFSTDEFAAGGVGPVLFPSLVSEAPVGDSSADVWIDGGGLPGGPLPPFAAPVGHLGYLDGDGLVSGSGAVYPGVGLIEPNPPGLPPDLGDNLDAFDWDPNGPTDIMPATGVYFSLDTAWIDPFLGIPNSGSAAAHGFSPSDVLWTAAPGGPPVLWAPAPALGLDIAGNQSDDLDALAIWENGSGAYEPSVQPYDWMTGATDMVLFSVRRGSPVIGMPDSIFGIPIAEGDILTTPLPTIFGGVSPFPGIFCAAENIGLSTLRSGNQPDDLNALDTIRFVDCNGNGIPDSADISSGTSTDVNGNGVPDECEIVGGPYCYCPAISAPCGNADPTAGCANSTGIGALLGASGTSSVALDNLVLTTTQMPPSKPGLYFTGPAMIAPVPFGDGLRCVGGGITRMPPVGTSTPGGVLSIGPGLAGTYGFLPFSTWNFQLWYRDPMGPCGSGFNTSSAYNVTFTP